jgi:hypothetical protein
VVGVTGLVESVSGVRIAINWNLLNSYSGLILPLVATATGTFLYRQFFMTVPDELVEAAKMDGSGPMRFFLDVLIPLSRTNMLALATIMFVWSGTSICGRCSSPPTAPIRHRDHAAQKIAARPERHRRTGTSPWPARSSSCCHRCCRHHHAALVRARPHSRQTSDGEKTWPP